MARFFLDPEAWDARPVLRGDEAKHCSRVMRLRAGDRIVVFDGRGRGAGAEIVSVARDEVEVRLGEVRHEARPPVEVVLNVAVLKGKAMEWLVQKATEVGAAAIQPVLTERVVASPDEGKADKWRRVALEACKQCGRFGMPELREPKRLEEICRQPVEGTRLIAALAPDVKPLRDALAAADGAGRIDILIGPEGDFTAAELELATDAGFQPVGLGPFVLRAETAALYALCCISCTTFSALGPSDD